MSATIFEVTVKQKREESYWDSEKEKKITYESSNEICGNFFDWEQVEVFTNCILRGFPNAVVEIRIVREGE